MRDKYLYAGTSAGPLASGAQYAPGDEVPASAVNPEHPHDKRLLSERVLVPLNLDEDLDDKTVAQVLEWVGDDPQRRQTALAAELGRDRPRKTLTDQLKETS